MNLYLSIQTKLVILAMLGMSFNIRGMSFNNQFQEVKLNKNTVLASNNPCNAHYKENKGKIGMRDILEDKIHFSKGDSLSIDLSFISEPILWHDGSIEKIRVFYQPQQIGVFIDYGNGCLFYDSSNLLLVNEPEIKVSSDKKDWSNTN